MAVEISAALARYLAARWTAEGERVEAVIIAMNSRERRLVREAAVMGYVRGTMAGRVAGREAREPRIPPDHEVLSEVISACLSMPDLYPTFERMERTAQRREASA